MTTKTFAVTAPDYSTTFGEDCKDSGHHRAQRSRACSQGLFFEVRSSGMAQKGRVGKSADADISQIPRVSRVSNTRLDHGILGCDVSYGPGFLTHANTPIGRPHT
jgi:hypothetical protein